MSILGLVNIRALSKISKINFVKYILFCILIILFMGLIGDTRSYGTGLDLSNASFNWLKAFSGIFSNNGTSLFINKDSIKNGTYDLLI